MAIPSSLPLIVLIHGSWHQPSCFTKIRTLLSNQGYTVLCPTLPTNDSSPQRNPLATHETDIASLHTQLLPYLDDGHEALLVGHSYGAIPAMGCILGNSVEERVALGKKGGIMGMVFLSGFAFPVRGMKLLSAMDVNWIEIQVPLPPPPSLYTHKLPMILTAQGRMGHRQLKRAPSPLQRPPRIRNRRNDGKSRSNERS
jgi:pimeloyl-ACP methyl ester carboxylesterase